MMKPKQFIVSVVNLAIFAIAGIALYELGNRNAWTGAGTQTTQQNIQTEVPVSVGTIETATLSRTLTAYGHIEPAPASTTQPAAEARVTVASASLVSEVDCIEGQHVEKGQLLFRLDHRAANAAVARAMQFLSASQAISDSLSPSSRPSDIPAWMTLVARWQVNLAQAQLQQAEAEKTQMRERLRQQLNAILETRETARGLIVNINDVLFDFNKYTLKPGAREKMAKVSGILLAYPGLKLQLEGHTDSVGGDDYNLQLSQQR